MSVMDEFTMYNDSVLWLVWNERSFMEWWESDAVEELGCPRNEHWRKPLWVHQWHRWQMVPWQVCKWEELCLQDHNRWVRIYHIIQKDLLKRLPITYLLEIRRHSRTDSKWQRILCGRLWWHDTWEWLLLQNFPAQKKRLPRGDRAMEWGRNGLQVSTSSCLVFITRNYIP